MRARRALLPIAAAAVLSAATPVSPARAASGDDAEAEAAIKRGVDLRRHAKDQEALEEFRKAYALVKSARALAQIGLAEQALGRWADAENDLAEAMSNKTDPWIRKNLATLNGAVDVIRKHLGSLDVIGPAGAELLVDGHSAGKLPLAKPARVPIGSLTIEVKKEGFFAATRPVSIAAGELTRESVDLQPVPPPPPKISGAGEQGGQGGQGGEAGKGGEAGGLPPPPPPPPPESGGGWQRGLAWGTAIGALVGVGAGVAELLIHNSKLTDASNLKCNISMGTVMPADPTNASQCVNLADSADSARVGAIIAFSVAGGLAITSALLFLTSSSPAHSAALQWSPHPGTMLVCAPSFGPSWLTPGGSCQLRF